MSLRKNVLSNLHSEEIADFSRRGLSKLQPLKKKISAEVLALWLNQNEIVSLENLQTFVGKVLEHPIYLLWIDLSTNLITRINESFSFCPNLKMLYLHNNRIEDLNEINNLAPLPSLRYLTLFANPISQENPEEYNSYIIQTLPRLLNLDFTPIEEIEETEIINSASVKRSIKSDGNFSLAAVSEHQDSLEHTESDQSLVSFMKPSESRFPSFRNSTFLPRDVPTSSISSRHVETPPKTSKPSTKVTKKQGKNSKSQ